MSLLGNLVINILGNNTGLDDAMKQAQKSVQNFGKGMTEVGKSLSALVTVPLVAVGGASLKVASDFESAFAGVRKTVDATEAEFEVLRQGIRDMAKIMPQSASEIARVGEAAGQLGIKTSAILGFTETMVNLGVATNLSSEEAATALARLANITQMPQENFDRLGSSIVALGNNFATTEAEITEMALRLAGAGSQVGMSEADILGLAAALSSVGIEAEMGGSAISRVMVNMQVAASRGMGQVQALSEQTGLSLRELQLLASNNSKDFTDLADALGMTRGEMKNIVDAGVDLQNFANIAGMTSEQFQKAFQDDAVGALGAFVEGLANAEERGTSAINMLEEMGISEIRLRDSLLRAGGASEVFAGAIQLSNEAWEENTALTDEAAERYKTFESQMQMLKNRLVDVGITLGDALMPVALQLMDALQPVIDKISELATAFGNLSPSTQRMIIMGAGIAAALGPVLIILGQVVTSVAALLPVLSALTGPVGLVIAAIAGLTAGLVYLYNTNDSVRASINEAWESIKEVALSVWGTISDFVMTQIDKIKVFWEENGTQILEAVRNVFEGIKSIIEFIMPAIRFVIDLAWTAIKQVIGGALDIIMGLIKVFSGLFTGDWSKMWEGIKQLLGGAIDFIMGIMTLNFLGGLRALFTNLLKSGLSIIGNMGTGIVNLFKSLQTGSVNLVSNMVKSVVNFFRNLLNDGINIFGYLRNVGATIWQAITQTIVGLARQIWTSVTTNFNGLLNSVRNIFGTVRTVIEQIWGKVLAFFKGINLSQIGKDIMQGLINGIGSMASAAVEKAKDVAESIGNTIKNFFGIKSPSRLTAEYGKNISEGLAVGINNSKDKAKDAIERLSGEAADTAAKAAVKAADKAQKQASAAAQKAASAANKSFQKAMDDATYKYKMGQVDEAGYVASLESVRKAYAKTGDQVQKVNLAIKKASDKMTKDLAAAAKKQFEDSKTYIEARKQANEITLQQELALWEKLQNRYKVGTKERITIDKQVNKIRAELDKQSYETSKSYIDARKQANEMTLADELAAWERVQARYKAGTDERIAAEQNVQRVRKEIYDSLVAANEDFLAKTKEINSNVEAEEKRLNEAYAQAVEQRAKAISDFAGLFDEVTMKSETTGRQLLDNLRGQVDYLAQWATNIQTLATRGIDQGLLEELRQMGPKAAPELAALNSLTDSELAEYQSLWMIKSQQARSVAVAELEGLRVDTNNKITQLHADAAVKLEAVRKEFETKVKSIRSQTTNEFNAMKASMPEIGKQAIQGLMNGLASMQGPLIEQAKGIADAISQTIKKALDIRSPSRVMMGLGQFIGEGLALGIQKSAGLAERAASLMSANVMDAATVDASVSGGYNWNGSGGTSSTLGEPLLSMPRYIQNAIYLDGKQMAESMSKPMYRTTSARARGEGLS